jgi:hypothetical protein
LPQTLVMKNDGCKPFKGFEGLKEYGKEWKLVIYFDLDYCLPVFLHECLVGMDKMDV